LFGFALGTVGVDIGTGAQRYTFGSAELIGGIDFIPLAIGLFGIGEILYSVYLNQHAEDFPYIKVSTKDEGFWPSRREWKESRWPTARGSVLGFLVGVLPGAGATIASLMSYSMEKSISKTPEKFGKGAIPGLIGPEAANNAASAGSLVPLLTLGIPGSGSTAVLLGAFLLYGLRPGPLLMTQNPEFAWGLIASMYLGNVVLVLLNIFAIPLFASFMKIPLRIAIPVIVVLCTIGTYTVNGSIIETWLMVLAGVLGFFMKRFGFSPAAAIVALVLGPIAEETLRQTLLISNGSPLIFYQRPVAFGLVILFAVLIAVPVAYRLIRGRSLPAVPGEED